MAEIEVHTHHPAQDDPVGKRVGFMVGLIGIVLAAVTIAAHRQHTGAVIHRTKANDQWSYYQAKKVREHVSAVGNDIVSLLDPGKAEAAKQLFDKQRSKYASDAEEIKTKAEHEDHAEGCEDGRPQPAVPSGGPHPALGRHTPGGEQHRVDGRQVVNVEVH